MSEAQDGTGKGRSGPVKRAVSFAVHEEGGGRVLAVLRPRDDPELPGLWGLPATSLREGESWRDALRRAGRDKLGVALEPVRLLAEGEQDRPLQGEPPPDSAPHRLRMRLYEAVIREGRPSVKGSRGPGTRYADARWAEPEELREAARRGSLCTHLYLDPPDP